jgi:VIT1/CCC1 family predicted Fe2+/Mn2+ transporter
MSGKESWYEEKQSAWLYREAARAETDPRMQRLFQSLAEAAEEQALIWAPKPEPPNPEPIFRPSTRARITARLIRRFGPKQLRPVLAAMKIRGLSAYQPNRAQEHIMPASVSDVGVRHKGMAGGNLRAAVFGVNDGLVSNASLLMGVAGAAANHNMMIMTGVAGLLAGALSMAAGEYVSVRSQREMYEYQIGLEREELNEYPDAEAEELALIYEARGMPLERARELSRELMKNPAHALDVLAREELGLNPEDLGSPVGAASFSFAAFASGALVPLVPYLLGATGLTATLWSAGAAATALVIVGAVLSLFTGRNAALGGLRMLLIGGGAGLISYVIGRAIGTSLG